MDKSKHKTWEELVKIERDKRRDARNQSKTVDIDIFGKSDSDIDIFTSHEVAENSSEKISWEDIVHLFYNIREQYPEVEICEVFLKHALTQGYNLQLVFKNVLGVQLDIQINDGEELYSTHIDERLSNILGDKENVMFEI